MVAAVTGAAERGARPFALGMPDVDMSHLDLEVEENVKEWPNLGMGGKGAFSAMNFELRDTNYGTWNFTPH